MANPLPADESEYYDSVWFSWLDRIFKAQEAEHYRIYKLSEDVVHTNDDRYDDEYYRAINISNNMCAAMIVAMYSNIEWFQVRLLRICLHPNIPISAKDNTYYIKTVDEELFKHLNIKIKQVECYETVNAVRIMSNCYKHNKGKYRPDREHPISPSIIEFCSMEENKDIKYKYLPFKRFLLNSSCYCCDLKTKVKCELNHGP